MFFATYRYALDREVIYDMENRWTEAYERTSAERSRFDSNAKYVSQIHDTETKT